MCGMNEHPLCYWACTCTPSTTDFHLFHACISGSVLGERQRYYRWTHNRERVLLLVEARTAATKNNPFRQPDVGHQKAFTNRSLMQCWQIHRHQAIGLHIPNVKCVSTWALTQMQCTSVDVFKFQSDAVTMTSWPCKLSGTRSWLPSSSLTRMQFTMASYKVHIIGELAGVHHGDMNKLMAER